MSNLLKSDRVVYECSCKEMYPIYNLFFCRHCSCLRCHMCVSEEIDVMFCPNCLENATVGEARLKKNRCSNCNQCPSCGSVLSTKSVGGETMYLVCSTCRWCSKNSDIPEQPNGTSWAVHENPLDSEIANVMGKMKSLAAVEKAQRDQAKASKRRTFTSGHLLPDRYGLQTIYQKRKKAMEKPVPQVPVHEAKENTEFLDFGKINAGPTAQCLEIQLRQPLSVAKPLRPVKLPLKARKALRCKSCDHNVIKLEFAPCTLKYKVHYFARNLVPEVRISRCENLVPDETASIFLTVTNESDAKADILLLPDPEVLGVECLSQIVELQLPPQDELADIDAQYVPSTGGECVVFRRRHKAGIRLEIKWSSGEEPVLGLLMKFKNELCTTATTEKSPEWRLARLRIRLQA